MKNLILSIAILFFSSVAFSQTNTKKVNVKLKTDTVKAKPIQYLPKVDAKVINEKESISSSEDKKAYRSKKMILRYSTIEKKEN